jgi:uncharacterized membrane protein
MRLLTLISPARNRTMKKVKMILFVYVAGALTAIAVMMALRGYAPFLFAGAGAVATWLVMRLPTWRRDARKASAAKRGEVSAVAAEVRDALIQLGARKLAAADAAAQAAAKNPGADFETLFIAALKSMPNRAKRQAAA